MTQLPDYFFGENYVKPDDAEPVVLTPQMRELLKDKMKIKLNLEGSMKPADFLSFAEQWLVKTHNLHINRDVLIEVVLEIQTDWGWIGAEEAPE